MTSSQMYLAFSGGMCENAGDQITDAQPCFKTLSTGSRGKLLEPPCSRLFGHPTAILPGSLGLPYSNGLSTDAPKANAQAATLETMDATCSCKGGDNVRLAINSVGSWGEPRCTNRKKSLGKRRRQRGDDAVFLAALHLRMGLLRSGSA